MTESALPKPPDEPEVHPVRVKAAGMRLDHYIRQHFGEEHSRSVVQRMIEGGQALVNGKPTKASYKVRPGDVLTLWQPEPERAKPQPEDIPLDVLYEDEYLALVNKPPDMVVHPARGNWTGTLVNALQFRFEELSEANGAFRAGIVHRLDRDTSGVILIAKDEKTHRMLGLQFENRHVFKEYAAICYGELDRDSDYIEAPLRQHPLDRVRMMVPADFKDPEAKEAISFYEVVERFRGFTYCRVQLKTGRTHQIRVHLTYVGCPILADKLYAHRDTFWLSEVTDVPTPDDDRLLLDRQALHAHRLRFQHPHTAAWVEAEAPLPEELNRVLDSLRRYRGGRASL